MRAQPAGSTVPGRNRRSGPQSVGRIFSILDAIAGSRTGATLSELAVIAGAPKTSLVGLLAGLTAEGCLFREASGRYSLGPRVHSLAMTAMVGRELVMLARPILHRLVEATGETAVIGTLAPDADLAVYLDKVESSNPIRYAVTVGERRELHCTAIGKALLAQFEPGRLKKYLRSGVRKRFTAQTSPARPTWPRKWRASGARVSRAPATSGSPAPAAWPCPSTGAAATLLPRC